MSMILHVGAKAPRFAVQSTFFDGLSGIPRRVIARADDTTHTLRVEGDSGLLAEWSLADIREVPDQAERDILVLRHKDDAMARLILPHHGVMSRLPEADRAVPATGRRRLVLWAMAAVASVALIVGVLVPRMADQLASYIPPEGERALGEVTLGQIRDGLSDNPLTPIGVCDGPAGLDALSKMEKRLTVQLDTPYELSVSVLDHDMVNAFALPGGYVVFFRGLIDKAGTPEEVAAVLAHEIGHVVSRDPTRHALRSAGSIGVLGLLFGDFAGGAIVLLLTERLIEAQYTQQAEADADTFAYDLLLRAGLSPGAIADFFARLQVDGADNEGFLAHFLSHPELGDRIEASRAAVPDGFQARPILTDTEWAALKDVCE